MSDSAGLVVIGGGPAGHSAAAAYRDAGGVDRVMLISADDSPPYQRPPLSKDFLRGESEADALPLESPEFYTQNNIELWLGDPVVQLDLAAGLVRTRSGRTLAYRKCVVATGCQPSRLPVPGADHTDVLRLRFLSQASLLRDAAARSDRAVVIGSGFIGCEVAASLATRGLDVTMLSSEELPQLKRLGRTAAERIASWLTDAGVRIAGNDQVVEIEDGRAVVTESGQRFEASMIVSAAGITPNTALAEAAGLALRDGRILVDERMLTGAPGVYAAGDVVLAHNATAGRRLKVEHWGEALRMGEIAGTNAAGGDQTWTEVPGFWSSIGSRTLKYTAWGDGFDHSELIDHPDGGFTVWYFQVGRTVGVLTHEADADYERGQEVIAQAGGS